MAGKGRLAAAFKTLAKDAGEAAGNATRSMAKLAEQTAKNEENNLARMLDTEAGNAGRFRNLVEDGSKAPAKPKPPVKLSDERPVDIRVPKWATKAQQQQFERYVAGANRAVAADALSSTGRVASNSNGVRDAAEKAAIAERDRAAAAGTPYQGVAGHVPDAAWMGKGQPYEWQDMDKQVNSSLAGQIRRYPVGYQPTVFRLVYPPE